MTTSYASSIMSDSKDFFSNREAMEKSLNCYLDVIDKMRKKSESARDKFSKRGKLLPHERINYLLDRNSAFLELCGVAGYEMYDDKDGSEAGGGIIAGIGTVSGIKCMIVANNSAIKGGTISPIGLKKSLRIQEIAANNHLPVITLAESGGANLNYASDIFVEGARGFANQARLSALGIPQITIVHGNATAGGAYQPGLSDYVIVVKEQAHLYLAGPPLLKAATGEIADDEALGGAQMHYTQAGTAEYLAANDLDAIRIVRKLLTQIPWHKAPSTYDMSLNMIEKAPLYSPDELIGVVPADPKHPYDVREVLIRISDQSELFDFKQGVDYQTFCGWISINGIRCGCIGNNGPITPAGAAKAAQFIQLCDQNQQPIIFFHNTTGFMVGTESEHLGIIKHGSKMIQAVANTRSPKIAIVVGGSYGAGNYAMCGRGLDPRFIFAWPNSRTAVMGGAQAGSVLRIIAEEKQRRKGIEPDPKVLDFLEESTKVKLEQQSTALYGSARLWDDGIIDPRDTRSVLIELLSIIHQSEQQVPQANTFGVARL